MGADQVTYHAALFEHFFGSLPREEKAKPKSTAKTPRVGATRK